jgi:ATP-binding cassette subfamily F protein 3
VGSIRLSHVTKQFGGQVVLHDVSLELHTGEIVALVGANGVGKTTLFRLIVGEIEPDIGTVTVSKGVEIGYLPQEPTLPAGTTLRAAVAAAFADRLELEQKLQELARRIAEEHDRPRVGELLAQYDRMRARFEAAGGYAFEQRLGGVLGGLGFSPADGDLPVEALSGGQKSRAALARLLLPERQFLLLDEPTNHLDIDAVRWLEKFLAGHHGGAAIISHDRYLLDRVAQRTIELTVGPNGGQIECYAGNYSDYVRTRDVHALTRQRQYEQDQARIAKEREYAARYVVGPRSRQVQGRLRRLAREMEAGELIVEKPRTPKTVRIQFTEPARGTHAAQPIVRASDLAKQYGEKVLFRDLSVEVFGGQRLGITGPNGTGKTTLLRILLGQVAADAGTVWRSPTVRIGYFAQEPEELAADRTVVQEILALRGDFLERDARHYAARFLFTGDDVFKQVGQLSGGEQSRLRLMKLILTAPDVLVLDEPTNHLDIPSREALEAALAEFPGAVLVVSHDRYFLDRVVQKLLVLRPGAHRLHPGNYSSYIAQVEQEEAARQAEQPARRSPARVGKAAGRAKQPRPPASPLARLPLEELERYIAEREERLAAVQQRFGDPAVYRERAALDRLRAEFDTLRAELDAAMAVWLDRAEQGPG